MEATEQQIRADVQQARTEGIATGYAKLLITRAVELGVLPRAYAELRRMMDDPSVDQCTRNVYQRFVERA